jgi:hypothetical protein
MAFAKENPACGNGTTLRILHHGEPQAGTALEEPVGRGQAHVEDEVVAPLDGLARVLSLDMRVLDPAWMGMKLRKLLNYSEPLGDFMAFVPGQRRQQTWPSTVAYLARLIIHRYAMLGVLDENGYPTREMGILEAPRDAGALTLLPARPWDRPLQVPCQSTASIESARPQAGLTKSALPSRSEPFARASVPGFRPATKPLRADFRV